MDEENRQEAAELKESPTQLLGHPRTRNLWMKKLFLATIFLVLFLFIWVFIFSSLGTSGMSPLQTLIARVELNRHEKLWQSQNISSYEYYEYTMEQGNSGSRQLFRVENGVVIDPLDYPNFIGLDPIENQFHFIRNWLNGAFHSDPPIFNVRVTYDNNLGYPTFVGVNYNVKTNEFLSSSRIEDFKILEQGQTTK